MHTQNTSKARQGESDPSSRSYLPNPGGGEAGGGGRGGERCSDQETHRGDATQTPTSDSPSYCTACFQVCGRFQSLCGMSSWVEPE